MNSSARSRCVFLNLALVHKDWRGAPYKVQGLDCGRIGRQGINGLRRTARGNLSGRTAGKAVRETMALALALSARRQAE